MGGCSTAGERTGADATRITFHCKCWAGQGTESSPRTQGRALCARLGTSPDLAGECPSSELVSLAAGLGECFVQPLLCCAVCEGMEDITWASVLPLSFPFFKKKCIQEKG